MFEGISLMKVRGIRRTKILFQKSAPLAFELALLEKYAIKNMSRIPTPSVTS